MNKKIKTLLLCLLMSTLVLHISFINTNTEKTTINNKEIQTKQLVGKWLTTEDSKADGGHIEITETDLIWSFTYPISENYQTHAVYKISDVSEEYLDIGNKQLELSYKNTDEQIHFLDLIIKEVSETKLVLYNKETNDYYTYKKIDNLKEEDIKTITLSEEEAKQYLDNYSTSEDALKKMITEENDIANDNVTLARYLRLNNDLDSNFLEYLNTSITNLKEYFKTSEIKADTITLTYNPFLDEKEQINYYIKTENGFEFIMLIENGFDYPIGNISGKLLIKNEEGETICETHQTYTLEDLGVLFPKQSKLFYVGIDKNSSMSFNEDLFNKLNPIKDKVYFTIDFKSDSLIENTQIELYSDKEANTILKDIENEENKK